jgi:hypothetical protein
MDKVYTKMVCCQGLGAYSGAANNSAERAGLVRLAAILNINKIFN